MKGNDTIKVPVLIMHGDDGYAEAEMEMKHAPNGSIHARFTEDESWRPVHEHPMLQDADLFDACDAMLKLEAL